VSKGGGDLVDVGDRTSGWCAVELEVLSPPPRLPAALASVRFLEVPSALLVEDGPPSMPPSHNRTIEKLA